MVITPPSWVAPLQLVYDTRVGAPRLIQSSTSAGVKTAPTHPETLRGEQSSRVCTTDSFLMAADVLGNLERRQQSIRETIGGGRSVVCDVGVIAFQLLIDVQVLPHRVLRDMWRRAGGADVDVKTQAGGHRRE
jgi:hypothetical protein